MNLVNEIDRLHDLTELAQKLRPEVQHEQVVGGSGRMAMALDDVHAAVVAACRALVAKADA